MFVKASLAAFVVVIVVVTFLALPRGDGEAGPGEAEAVARHWVGSGTVQPARLEDDGWAVDVLRRDGSLVELTFDGDLSLRHIDEELGRGGAPAYDEIQDPLRRRAIRVALGVTGTGRVTSVERDRPDEIEVNVTLPGGNQVEVELDSALRVGEVEDEDPGDE
jgi:hypothetical protein